MSKFYLKWLFRKTHQITCKHFKEAGEQTPSNMRMIVRFGETIKFKGELGHTFGIAQCTECGTRAFSCLMCCAPSGKKAKAIDDFIAYKITLDEMVKHFAWHELESEDSNGQN